MAARISITSDAGGAAPQPVEATLSIVDEPKKIKVAGANGQRLTFQLDGLSDADYGRFMQMQRTSTLDPASLMGLIEQEAAEARKVKQQQKQIACMSLAGVVMLLAIFGLSVASAILAKVRFLVIRLVTKLEPPL